MPTASVTVLPSFNPRACVRRDARGRVFAATRGRFQSTRLREARPGAGQFQDPEIAVSIHAPA